MKTRDISSLPALQNAEQGTITSFHNRITRWAKLRNAMVPLASFCEPFSECMLLGALTTWSVMVMFSWDPISFFFIHILLWFFMDWILLLVIQNGFEPVNKFNFFVVWVYRELTVPYLYVISFITPEIKWGSKRFRLRLGGIVELCEDAPLHYLKQEKLKSSLINSINCDEQKMHNMVLTCG